MSRARLLRGPIARLRDSYPIRIDGFSPTDVADLRYWLDAQQEEAANGDRPEYWYDRSGNGFHARQATAGTRPTFRRGDPAYLAGLPCFDMARSWWFTAGDSINLSPVTLFIVAQRTDDGSNGYSIVFGCVNGGNTRFYVQTGDDVSMQWVTGAGDGPAITRTGGAPPDPDLDLTNAPFLMQMRGNGSTKETWVGDGYDNHVDGNATTDTPNIGNVEGTSSYPWPGVVAEVIYYRRALDEQERQKLARYLTAKWPVQGAFL